MTTQIGLEKMPETMLDLYNELLKCYDKANRRMEELLGEPRAIDELAVLFPAGQCTQWKWDFMLNCIKEFGWALTGVSEDQVSCQPIDASYFVNYYFLTNPHMNFRIECLELVSGFSPIHFAASERTEAGPAIMHASWKPPTTSLENEMANYVVERVKLEEAGCRLAQECESSYGRFAYYAADTSALPVYLKPRVNTRDAK